MTDTIHKPVKLQQVSGRRVKVVACGRSFTLLTLFQSSAPEKQLSYAWGANWCVMSRVASVGVGGVV